MGTHCPGCHLDGYVVIVIVVVVVVVSPPDWEKSINKLGGGYDMEAFQVTYSRPTTNLIEDEAPVEF